MNITNKCKKVPFDYLHGCIGKAQGKLNMLSDSVSGAAKAQTWTDIEEKDSAVD